MHRGFSIGISDVSPSPKLKKVKFDILSEGYKKVCAGSEVPKRSPF